jgi:hypothetical protein
MEGAFEDENCRKKRMWGGTYLLNHFILLDGENNSRLVSTEKSRETAQKWGKVFTFASSNILNKTKKNVTKVLIFLKFPKSFYRSLPLH